MNNHHFIYICLLFFSFSCSDKSVVEGEPTSEVNENIQQEIEIYYSNDGGMSPISENIYISNDSACWKYGRYREEVIISWTPTSKDITSLIAVLEKNEFRSIESNKKEEVFDRGGVQIKIEFNEVKTDLDNSGLSFIKEEWRDNFRAIRQSIQDYVQSEVEKQLLTLRFTSDVSVYESKEPIKVWLNNELFYDSKEQQAQPLESITLYPGVNKYDWTIYYADSVGYNNRPVRKNGGESKFDASSLNQEVIILKQDGEILLDVR